MKKWILLFLLLVWLIPLNITPVHAKAFDFNPPEKIVSASIQSPATIWYTGTGDAHDYFLIKDWDGAQFQIPQGLPAPTSYQSDDSGEAILALSKENVWAIGTGPDDKQPIRIYHLSGTSWHTIPGPVNREAIHAMSAVSTDDIWAVGSNSILGYNNGLDLTYSMHWDGKSWKYINSPHIMGFNTTLWGVSAVSTNDVWAVGNIEGENGGDRSLIEHWNGKTWQIIPSPALASPALPGYGLKSVSALSTNDIWAAGNYNQGCNPANKSCSSSAFIEHWNGKAWKIAAQFPSGEISAIDAHTANDIWAVGDDQKQQCDSDWNCRSLTFIEHWNGQTWQHVNSPTPYLPGIGYDGSLVTIRAFSQKNIWAIGQSLLEAKVFLEHWDGQTWGIVAQNKLS